MLHATAMYKIVSPWRMRNDGNYTVAYFGSCSHAKHKLLSLVQAILIPFIDGKYEYRKIKNAVCRVLLSLGIRENADQLIDDNIEDLIKSGIVSDTSKSLKSSAILNKKKLIPNAYGYDKQVNRLNRPLSVFIEITQKCQTNCIYCYAQRKFFADMPFKELITIFDECFENEIFIVGISGGDIFLRKDIYEVLKEMCSRNFTFALSTKSFISKRNASILSDLSIGTYNLPEHLNREIQFSIDTVDEKIAKILVGNSDHVKIATSTIKNLTSKGIQPKIKSVLTSYNLDCPRKIVQYFYPIGVRHFTFARYMRSFYHHKNDALFVSKKNLKKIDEQMLYIKTKYPDITLECDFNSYSNKNIALSLDEWNNRLICSGGRTSMYIKQNGDATLCEQMPHQHGYIFGNIIEKGLINTWQSKSYESFVNIDKSKLANTPCYNCEHFELCFHKLGICYRDSLFAYNNQFTAPPLCPFQNREHVRLS